MKTDLENTVKSYYNYFLHNYYYGRFLRIYNYSRPHFFIYSALYIYIILDNNNFIIIIVIQELQFL